MIANLEPTAECSGNLLKASVAPDGTYTMTNMRNGFSKSLPIAMKAFALAPRRSSVGVLLVQPATV